METKKRLRGRPVGTTKDNPSDHRLPNIRVTKDQIDTYKATATDKGKTLSAWVKDTLDKEAGK